MASNLLRRAFATVSTSSSHSSLLSPGFPLVLQTSHNPYATTGKWLASVGGLVVGMIHIGGWTRLTGSGLSMTDWSPTGSLPPLSLQEWHDEFAKYQTFPEWQQRQHMTLREFQYIYAWEYGHRMLGRCVGLAFGVPWLYLTWRRRIPPGLQPRLLGLGLLGATQGVVGWWMVQSGLGEDRRGEQHQIKVQPIRLATHLSLAMITYGALVWTALDVLRWPHRAAMVGSSRWLTQCRIGAVAVTGLTFVTVVSGALVAGNDAGRAYNTFPTMNGQWIPLELYELQPWTRSLTEHTATVQWNHRVLATTTAVTGLSLVAVGLRRPSLLTPQIRQGLWALGVTVTGQFALGVVTLLNYVPIGLGVAHQLGSVAVFTSGVYLAHSFRYVARSGPSIAKTVARHS